MKRLLGKVFLLLAGLVIGIGGGFGAAQSFGGDLPFLPQRATAQPAAASTPVREAHGGIMFPTRERVVNLADPGIMRYLKTTIVLELDDPVARGGALKGEEYKKRQDELAKELRGQTPLIDDQVTAILSSKTSSELLTPAGKEQLKEEIKTKLNSVLVHPRVLAVYFSDFIIQ